MGEIKRGPIVSEDAHGNESVTFDSDHTVADIARWILAQDWVDDFRYLMAEDMLERTE